MNKAFFSGCVLAWTAIFGLQELTIEGFLREHNIKVGMGHIVRKDTLQAEQLVEFIECHPEIKKVCEIGFNAGHSSELFLTTRDDIEVLSFDIGTFSYVGKCKEWLDRIYPNRHRLIIGDSTKTLPRYLSECSTEKFDLIFIDGGHTYDIAKSDIANSVKLAHEGTFIIIDDLKYAPVLRAWEEALASGLIEEVERYEISNKYWAIGKPGAI